MLSKWETGVQKYVLQMTLLPYGKYGKYGIMGLGHSTNIAFSLSFRLKSNLYGKFAYISLYISI